MVDQDDDNVGGGDGVAPQPIQARPPIPDVIDNDGGLGAVHQVLSWCTKPFKKLFNSQT